MENNWRTMPTAKIFMRLRVWVVLPKPDCPAMHQWVSFLLTPSLFVPPPPPPCSPHPPTPSKRLGPINKQYEGGQPHRLSGRHNARPACRQFGTVCRATSTSLPYLWPFYASYTPLHKYMQVGSKCLHLCPCNNARQ